MKYANLTNCRPYIVAIYISNHHNNIFIRVHRCRTIVKTCVAINVTIFHRELNVESTLMWVSSIKVDKSDNKMGRPPSTGKYTPAIFAGLTAFTKILFTFCSFFGKTIVSICRAKFKVRLGETGYNCRGRQDFANILCSEICSLVNY